MGHYSTQEEAAILARSETKCTPRSDRNGSCPLHGNIDNETIDDIMGFTMETRRGYIPDTADTRMEDHGYRKIQKAPCVGNIPVDKIQRAVDTVSKEFPECEKTTFASGAQKDVTGKPRFDLIPPEAMKALAETYALGAVKYSDRNWEKGIPFSAALGALKRHLNAFELGDMINRADGDIEHIAHVMWWAVALTTFVKRGRLDLNDLPHYNELLGD